MGWEAEPKSWTCMDWDSDEKGSGLWCAGDLIQLGCSEAEQPGQRPV